MQLTINPTVTTASRRNRRSRRDKRRRRCDRRSRRDMRTSHLLGQSIEKYARSAPLIPQNKPPRHRDRLVIVDWLSACHRQLRREA
jgi:hypothetical protein